jgi:hypothetical protein
LQANKGIVIRYLFAKRDDRQAAICGNKHKTKEIQEAVKIEAQQ